MSSSQALDELDEVLTRHTSEFQGAEDIRLAKAAVLSNLFKWKKSTRLLKDLVALNPKVALDMANCCTPTEAVGLMVELGISKAGYRDLLTFFRSRDQAHHRRVFPPRRQTFAEWKGICKVLKIQLVRDRTTGVSSVLWRLSDWLAYVESEPALYGTLDLSEKLVFIVRGDGFPVSGSCWSQLNVTLRNWGKLARTTSHTFVIGLAYREDKDMALLARLWQQNIQVCFVVLMGCSIERSIEAPTFN